VIARSLLFALALAAGVLAGQLFPQVSPTSPAAAATESLTLRVHPGPEAQVATLLCSWHEACRPPITRGPALDWANGHETYAPNRPVFWRSHAYRSGGTGGVIAYGTIVAVNHEPHAQGCAAVEVRIVDVFNFDKGKIRYVHSRTWVNGWRLNIWGSPSWSWTNVEIGFSWQSENQWCIDRRLWEGQHLHQDPGLSDWDRQRWQTNWNNFLWVGSNYDVLAPNNWQHQQSWNWNY
jgi:hypothetical protein